jgi:Uma2 family endonuclease
MGIAAPDRPEMVGEPDGLYEVVDGCIVEKLTGAYECWLTGVISDAITPHVKDRLLGRTVVQMIFDFRPTIDRERRPDVAFISFERWARNRPLPQTRSWAVVPDLAIEIVSLWHKGDEVAEKLEDYFRVGVRSVWVVYPRQFKVYAYRSPTEVRVLALGEALDGGDVVPGFRVRLEAIFEESKG